MTATDTVWRVFEAYGMLIGMLLSLALVVATAGVSLWRRQLQWTGVILGSVGMLLVAFSLWLSRDLDLSQRHSVQSKTDELLTRLEFMSGRMTFTILGLDLSPESRHVGQYE